MTPRVKCIVPGSAGCQPAMLGSLPSMIFFGKLPALPNPEP
jgi:hypothetical protein